jgi:succinate-acetate transporter protein
MSEEGSFGISAAERFFGLILLAVGLILMYYTLTSMDVLKAFTAFFGFLSLIFIILGIVLITAKVE